MMHDNDLMIAVREPFAGVRMATPVEAVVTRGRAVRRYRRIRAAAGAAAAGVAAGVLAITAAAPGGGTGPVVLAAWTVTSQPSGTVAVTIHDLRNPLGLQRALRAHHVPAIVRFHPAGSLMPGCVIDLHVPGGARLAAIYRHVFIQPPVVRHGGSLLTIDPAAIPHGAQIGIDAQAGGFGLALLTPHGRCLPPSTGGGVGIRHS